MDKQTISLVGKHFISSGHYNIIVYDDKGTQLCAHKSNNMRAIDGHDGADKALAIEALRANDINEQDYDLSELDGGGEDD